MGKLSRGPRTGSSGLALADTDETDVLTFVNAHRQVTAHATAVTQNITVRLYYKDAHGNFRKMTEDVVPAGEHRVIFVDGSVPDGKLTAQAAAAPATLHAEVIPT